MLVHFDPLNVFIESKRAWAQEEFIFNNLQSKTTHPLATRHNELIFNIISPWHWPCHSLHLSVPFENNFLKILTFMWAWCVTLTLLITCSHIQTIDILNEKSYNFSRMTLTLIQWPWYSNLTYPWWRCTCIAKTQFLREGVQNYTLKRLTDKCRDKTENITYPHRRMVKMTVKGCHA